MKEKYEWVVVEENPEEATPYNASVYVASQYLGSVCQNADSEYEANDAFFNVIYYRAFADDRTFDTELEARRAVEQSFEAWMERAGLTWKQEPTTTQQGADSEKE